MVDRRYSEPVGYVQITLTPDGRNDPLLGELPGIFGAFTGHKEAISELPGHATLLASSPACPVQAFRVGFRLFTSTQFHPELDVAGLCTRIEVYKHAGYFEPHEADDLKARAADCDVVPPTGHPAPVRPALRHRFQRWTQWRPGRRQGGDELPAASRVVAGQAGQLIQILEGVRAS